VRERVELVHGAGTSMKAIVDDILDVSKMESGKIRLSAEEFGVAATIREVTRVFSDQAEAKGVQFACELDDCPPRGFGDEQRFRQVVFNLVSNAVKFTESGRICVCAAPAQADPDQLVVTVEDCGIGIPPDQVEKIFEPFHQVDGSRTRQFSGTGLGLTISRELTENMGGTLTVESAVGRGSTFTLAMPLRLTDVNKTAEMLPEAAVEGEATPLVYAVGALMAAIAQRAFEAAPASPILVDSVADAQQAVAERTVSAVYAVFDIDTQAELSRFLKDLRRDQPEMAIYGIGWPAGADGMDTLFTDRAGDLSALSGLVDKTSVTTDRTEPNLARQVG
jgi:anti-sigma regulatory factor (Ser/Thr protein kinase)